MGLDMYLTRKISLSTYDHILAAEREMANAVITTMSLDPSDYRNGTITVSLPEFYWRKANAIHSWFVENVQDGEDNCQEHYVTAEQLRELQNLCRQVLINPALAREVLPTKTGFFFGETEYDENYLSEIRTTVKAIDRILAIDRGDLYYQSSW